MPRFSAHALAAPALAPASPMANAASDDAQRSLELLLELGVQILDGDASLLLGLPAALSTAIGHLHDVHDALKTAARAAPTRFFGVFTKHAEHRMRSDLGALSELSEAVSEAQHPTAVGRSVVVTALMLLSNLAADERWLHAMALGARQRRSLDLVTAVPACVA